jgi:hypothetical protein
MLLKQDDFKTSFEKMLAEQCSSVIFSRPAQEVSTILRQIDDLLDKSDTPGSAAPSATPAASSSPDLTNKGFVYLLVLNRFGPLVVVFFFSSLIIGLYRYNSRLISYYYARLYAIQALDGRTSTEQFATTVATFSPDAIDFGRLPRTPLDIAGDVAEKIAAKIDLSKLSK